jgi:hypothetical protein
MPAYACPLCPRTFTTKKAFTEHLVLTTKHKDLAEYLADLAVLLAEAERAVVIYREQRNEWRTRAQRA